MFNIIIQIRLIFIINFIIIIFIIKKYYIYYTMFNIIDIIEKNEFINWLQVFVIKYFYIKTKFNTHLCFRFGIIFD